MSENLLSRKISSIYSIKDAIPLFKPPRGLKKREVTPHGA